MSNSLTRILVAVVGIPIAVAIVYWGGLALALLVAALGALGAAELVNLARRQGVEPLRGLAIGMAALVPLGIWLLYGRGSGMAEVGPFTVSSAAPSAWNFLAALTLIVLAGTLAWRAPTERPLAAAAITLLAPLYCGVLPSFLLGIRYGIGPGQHWPATWAVLLPLGVTWVCDTFAMYAGKLVGGPKLAPIVSPGKTRSGAVGGVIGGVLAAVALNVFAMRPSGFVISTGQAVLLGFVIAIVAQIGDLAESLFKREANVKDSSRLVPGHGGVLDRLDSLYFVIPVAAISYRLMGLV